MARRTVNGNTHSENGWPLVDEAGCAWSRVPGASHVSIQLQTGVPTVAILAFLADYHAYIEPLRDADTGGWTRTNDVLGRPGKNNGSNHLGGTCCDANWQGPPEAPVFRLNISKERAYPGGKARALDELLAWWEGIIFCGGEWSIRDWMHFQLGAGTWDRAADRPSAKIEDFIRRKIRPDGFSTYKRGGNAGSPAPVPANRAPEVLARATGITITKATEIATQVSFALVKGNCNNPRRIAAALAQWVVESGHFVYTEEIASGPENQERWKYKGRTWIQLTWLENYLGFSRWCHGLGLVPTPTYFGDRPRELAEQRWAALGPAYWWAIKYPKINEYADRGDIDNVSKWVNAPAWVDNPNKHANGERERRDAYNKALALGDQLLTLTDTTNTGDDELSEQAERMIRELHAFFLTEPLESLSPLRKPGEGKIAPLGRFLRYMDANTHVPLLKALAEVNHPDTMRELNDLANVDLAAEPNRGPDRDLARAILANARDYRAAIKAINASVGKSDVQQSVSTESSVPEWFRQGAARDMAQANATIDSLKAQLALAKAERDEMKAERDLAQTRITVPVPDAEPVFEKTTTAYKLGTVEDNLSTGALMGQAFDAAQALQARRSELPSEVQKSIDAVLIVLQPESESK